MCVCVCVCACVSVCKCVLLRTSRGKWVIASNSSPCSSPSHNFLGVKTDAGKPVRVRSHSPNVLRLRRVVDDELNSSVSATNRKLALRSLSYLSGTLPEFLSESLHEVHENLIHLSRSSTSIGARSAIAAT